MIEEIETAEGERRYYDQQVALSTIVVELREPDATRTNSWAPLTEAFGESLSTLAESTAALVLLVMACLPWALVGLGVYSVARRLIRRRAARKRGIAEAVASAGGPQAE